MRAAVEKYGARRVVVTSFTKAAAREIAGRDLAELDEQNVGTLHALCFRALGRPTLAEAKLKEWNERVANAPEWQVDAGGVDIDDSGSLAGGGSSLLGKANRWRGLMIPH